MHTLKRTRFSWIGLNNENKWLQDENVDEKTAAKGNLRNVLKKSLTTKDERDNYQYLFGKGGILMKLDGDTPTVPEKKKPICQVRYIDWVHH